MDLAASKEGGAMLPAPRADASIPGPCLGGFLGLTLGRISAHFASRLPVCCPNSHKIRISVKTKARNGFGTLKIGGHITALGADSCGPKFP